MSYFNKIINNLSTNRVVFKLLASGVNFILAVAIGVIVPRVVGPEKYGELAYINSTVTFLIVIFSLKSNLSYVYLISDKKNNKNSINTIYFSTLSFLIIFIVAFFLVSIKIPLISDFVWNDIDNSYLIILGIIISVSLYFQKRFIEYSDCFKHTINAEILRLLTRAFLMFGVIVFFILNRLTLYIYCYFWCASLIFFIIIYFCIVPFRFGRISFPNFQNIYKQFWVYLKPLILFSLISAVYSYIGKYILQYKCGSIEQGYYNFAYSLAMIPVIIFTSILTIYMNKLTVLFNDNNPTAVKELFLSSLDKAYVIHSFIAIFCFIYAYHIIDLLVGEKFLGAVGALQFLSVFSLLNSIGMLSGYIFLSSRRNKLYSYINSICMIMGICCFIFLYFLGTFNATILAGLMVVFYGVRIGIQLYYNSCLLNFNIFIVFCRLLGITLLIAGSITTVSLISNNIFWGFILSIVIIAIINYLLKDYLKLLELYKAFKH